MRLVKQNCDDRKITVSIGGGQPGFSEGRISVLKSTSFFVVVFEKRHKSRSFKKIKYEKNICTGCDHPVGKCIFFCDKEPVLIFPVPKCRKITSTNCCGTGI
jgi:hypothetical protein